MAFGKFGKYHPDGADVHLSDVDVVALVRREAAHARIRLAVDIERRTIQTDPLHVQYIVVNLLHNALKYSDGPVDVRLAANGEGARLEVADTGIGIPRTELDALFSPFFRASNVAGRPGTGMGLPIVKKSANLVGARIAVESTVGAGTTFTVDFPAAVSATRS